MRPRGFWPDIIGTDLHTGTFEGPAYDMPTVLTRMLYLGMPLGEVIRGATVAPAEAIGWSDRIGTLGVGREADVAVLSLDDVDMDLEDCQGSDASHQAAPDSKRGLARRRVRRNYGAALFSQ